MRLLLAAGAKLDLQAESGRTALMSAASAGHVEIVRALLDAGANANLKDIDGKSALDHAREPAEYTYKDNAALIKLLQAASARN